MYVDQTLSNCIDISPDAAGSVQEAAQQTHSLAKMRLDFRHERITTRRFPSSFPSACEKANDMVFWTNLSLAVRQPALRLTWLYVPCIQSPPEMRGNMATQVALHDCSGRLLQLTA